MATKKSTILVMSQVYVPDPTSVGQHMHDAAKELASRGIDPQVFFYQIRMNEREGGVTQLFSFASDEDFADFLLEWILDFSTNPYIWQSSSQETEAKSGHSC